MLPNLNRYSILSLNKNTLKSYLLFKLLNFSLNKVLSIKNIFTPIYRTNFNQEMFKDRCLSSILTKKKQRKTNLDWFAQVIALLYINTLCSYKNIQNKKRSHHIAIHWDREIFRVFGLGLRTDFLGPKIGTETGFSRSFRSRSWSLNRESRS